MPMAADDPESIIKSVLRRPLDNLVPAHDLAYLLEVQGLEFEQDSQNELLKVYGAKVYESIKKSSMSRDTITSITKQLEQFEDEELDALEFVAPEGAPFVERELSALDLAGNERFLVAKESVVIKGLDKRADSKNIKQEDVEMVVEAIPIVPHKKLPEAPISELKRAHTPSGRSEDFKRLKFDTQALADGINKMVEELEDTGIEVSKVVPIMELLDAQLYDILNSGSGSKLTYLSIETIKEIQRKALACFPDLKSSLASLDILKEADLPQWSSAAHSIHKLTSVYMHCLKIVDFSLEVVHEEALTEIIQVSKGIIDTVFNHPSVMSTLSSTLRTLPRFLIIVRELIESFKVSDGTINTILMSNLNWINISFSLDVKFTSMFSGLIFCSAAVVKAAYIFYPSERDYILKTLMENVSSFKEIRPENRIVPHVGQSKIHISSYILLIILQFTDIESVTEEHFHFIKNQMYSESFVASKGFEDVIQQKRDQCTAVVTALCEAAKSGNKAPLEAFVSDILIIFNTAYYPVTTLVVRSLVEVIGAFIHSDNLPQPAETFFLGICGEICRTILSYDAEPRTDNTLDIQSQKLLKTLRFLYHSTIEKGHEKFAYSYLIASGIVELLKVYRQRRKAEIFDFDSGDTKKTMDSDILNSYSSLMELLTTNEETARTFDQIDPWNMEMVPPLENEGNILVDLIVRSLKSPRIKTRAKAINIISKLQEFSGRLTFLSVIKSTLPKMLYDNSAMVRDSVLDFFYEYLGQNRGKADLVYDHLTECLSDESPQVRKSALKITKSIFNEVTTDEARGRILSKLLRRLDDDDDNLKCTSVAFVKDLFLREPCFIAPILVRMLKGSAKSANDLESFLERKVFVTGGEELQEAIKNLLEYLLDSALINEPTKKSGTVSGTLMFISIITRCSGKIFPQSYFTTLQPYLMDEDHQSESLHYTLVILKHTLPFFGTIDGRIGEEIISHLLGKLSKLGVRDLHEAVPVLSILCKFQGDNSRLANATVSSLKLTATYIENFQKLGSTSCDSKLLKLLHLIGCFGSYCDFNGKQDVFMKSSLGMKAKESVTSLITKFLLVFTSKKFEVQTRSTAIRNVLNICSTHPQLYMNDKVLNIIATELQNDEDGATKIKQIIVQNLFDFVRHEDKESRRRIGVETKSSSNENLDVVAFNGGGKAYVNDGICSSLIQRFISKILGLCFDPNHTFALISVQFCKLVFTLGYENPKLCISTFIGLEASESSIIRNKAHGVLRDLFNKHESLFDSSYSEGFKYAVEYRSSIADGLSTSRYYISILYSVVSKTVSARRKFITAINKSLQNYSSLDKQDHSQEFGRNFIYFMLQNLASVSFLTLEETYMIAETINNILSHQGLDLYDKVKALEENKSKKVVCIQSQAMICFLEFNSFLISKYGLNVERIANFKLERIDTELRSHPKVQRELVFDLDASDMKADLEEMSTVEAILGKFVSSMHFYNNN